jgi:O-antigen/teichoic acid export membrane protein
MGQTTDNLTSQWIATAYNAGVSIFLMFLLGRVLGPEAFGRYSYILTLASLFFILQDGGFKTLLFREKTLPSPGMKGHTDQLFSWALGNTLLFTLLGVLCVLVLPVQYRLGIIVAFLYFGLYVVSNFISSVLRGDGMFPREARWQVLVRTLGAAGILMALFFVRPEPWAIFGGWFLGVLICLFLSPVPLPKPSFDGFRIPDVRRACLGFLAIDAATVVYYRCDIILLEYLTGNSAEVGYYSAAYRFLEGIVLMAVPLRVIWFRKLRLAWEDKRVFEGQMVKMGIWMLVAACLAMGVGILFSQEIVFFTFGWEYADSVSLLPWLLVALVFVLPNGILTQGAVARNLERYYAVAAGFSALLNIGLNLVLIPEFGGKGAAWATVATEGFLMIVMVIGLRWKMRAEHVEPRR